jgi:hypothetical protein
VRFCLPDLADTGPGVFIGVISALGARSRDAEANPVLFSIQLGLRFFAEARPGSMSLCRQVA